MKKKVLLFTDLGIDDAFAILYTFFRKDIQLAPDILPNALVPRLLQSARLGMAAILLERARSVVPVRTPRAGLLLHAAHVQRG